MFFAIPIHAFVGKPSFYIKKKFHYICILFIFTQINIMWQDTDFNFDLWFLTLNYMMFWKKQNYGYGKKIGGC